jgi:hypothetical protein
MLVGEAAIWPAVAVRRGRGPGGAVGSIVGI